MGDIAVNLPLDGSEIRQIILQRLEKRMENNSQLANGIAYSGFKYDLTLVIKLEHATNPETLVWDLGQEGMISDEAQAEDMGEKYESKPPNVERQDNGLALTVEATDTKGKKSFKKVRIKE